ncbi:hypothetical protein SBI_03817 [Streptomyces bingchenggensis BCW-1]|uniref:Uncharacterized protein n=1 Tax=Streptomyces bingchenggensis (strain BCW-1) TaxID=749414 RepID=D7CG30_STRBB|nr:hypothetical protein SBI_03817 [Streptomyces bingchenggensis BCW-1]
MPKISWDLTLRGASHFRRQRSFENVHRFIEDHKQVHDTSE